jgi:hypothetical protein
VNAERKFAKENTAISAPEQVSRKPQTLSCSEQKKQRKTDEG